MLLTDDERDELDAKDQGITVEQLRAGRQILTNTTQILASDKPPVDNSSDQDVAGVADVAHSVVGVLEAVGTWPGDERRQTVIAERLGPNGWERRAVAIERQGDGSSRELSEQELETARRVDPSEGGAA